MHNRIIQRIVSVSTLFPLAVLAIFSLIWWLGNEPPMELYVFRPGLDNKPENVISREESVKIGEFFEEFSGTPSSFAGEWPEFRGPDRDNINKETISLIDTWGDDGPDVLWRVELGEGHASPAIAHGSVYLLDYDEEKKADALRCFSLDTGEELWRRWYPVSVKRNHGMSRAAPAVSESCVVTMGPRCHVMCVDAYTGDFLWGIDLEKEYATIVPAWYTAQCPVIDGDTAVIAPGGNALMIGVDCKTGEVVWETGNPHGLKMSHSSIMPMTIHGVHMYVYSTLGGLCAVGADEDNRGEILWFTRAWDNAVIAPSPVIFPDNRIFLTAGYGAGSMMIRVSIDGNGYTTGVLWEYGPREGLACEQQTPVLYQGHLFGILPKDAGPYRNQFICYDPAERGNRILWTSGKEKRFGLGPYLLADGKFFILRDDGVLTIARASLQGYEELDHAQVLSGRDAWGPLALTGGRLLARDTRELVCINVAAERK